MRHSVLGDRIGGSLRGRYVRSIAPLVALAVLLLAREAWPLLAIVQRLVTLMGGRLTVESEPGRGSTFRFTALFGLAAEDAPPVAGVFLHQPGRRLQPASPASLALAGGMR